jgi:DNA-binding transcriptional LysR family regulator
VSTRPEQTLTTLRDATWIAGCDRCRSHLMSMCADKGFEPRIGYTSENMVVMETLVVAGLGVTIMPGLALRSPRQGHRGDRAARIAPAHLRGDLRRTTRPTRHHRAPGSPRRSRASGRHCSHNRQWLNRPGFDAASFSEKDVDHAPEEPEAAGPCFRTRNVENLF